MAKREKSHSEEAEERRLGVVVLVAFSERSKAELAAAAGVSESSLTRYLNGQAPSLTMFHRIVTALGLGLRREELLRHVRALRRLVADRNLSRERDPLWDDSESLTSSDLAETLDRLLHDTRPERKSGISRLSPSAADREKAEDLWEALEPLPAADRLFLVATAREYQHWALSELLCERSLEAPPQEALELLELALDIAWRVSGTPIWKNRLEGYVTLHRADACRRAGNFAAAKEEFAEGRRLWEDTRGCNAGLLDEKRVRELMASLRESLGGA
jgi:transcriptional regulator with XRE-family HTH domain